jgi:hypothetical protein
MVGMQVGRGGRGSLWLGGEGRCPVAVFLFLAMVIPGFFLDVAELPMNCY